MNRWAVGRSGEVSMVHTQRLEKEKALKHEV